MSQHTKIVSCITGLEKIIVTAGSLPEAAAALKLAQTDGNALCLEFLHANIDCTACMLSAA